MESSTSTSHFRSISLPSRLTHHSDVAIETKINELKAWQHLVYSSQTIQRGLVKLADLYVSVNELFASPQTQQALSQHQSDTLVEDALEVSVVLLDSCSILKELMMQMKEQSQILQSALRRKGDDLTVAKQIAAYLCFRKKANKSIIKSLGTLKHLENKTCLVTFPEVDHRVSMVSKVLGEVHELTISLFKTLLVFLSPKSKPAKGVRILSMLALKSKSCTDEKYNGLVNVVETADMFTILLHRKANNKEMKGADVQMTLKKLEDLDVSVDEFEVGINNLFRRMVQNRASLLNMVVF